MARTRKEVSISGGLGIALTIIGAGMNAAVPDMIVPPIWGYGLMVVGFLILVITVIRALMQMRRTGSPAEPIAEPTIGPTSPVASGPAAAAVGVNTGTINTGTISHVHNYAPPAQGYPYSPTNPLSSTASSLSNAPVFQPPDPRVDALYEKHRREQAEQTLADERAKSERNAKRQREIDACTNSLGILANRVAELDLLLAIDPAQPSDVSPEDLGNAANAALRGTIYHETYHLYARPFQFEIQREREAGSLTPERNWELNKKTVGAAKRVLLDAHRNILKRIANEKAQME